MSTEPHNPYAPPGFLSEADTGELSTADPEIQSHNPDDRRRARQQQALRKVREHVDRLQEEFREDDQRSDRVFRIIIVGSIVLLAVLSVGWVAKYLG